MGYLQEIYDYIRSGETGETGLGLEIEHFVINEEGNQIPFHEISPLIREVGEKIGAELIYMDGYPVGYANEKYTVSLEPACQFEISISPYSELREIEAAYGEFRALWEPLFTERGYHLVTKGNLPLVESGAITPDDIPLSPKKRYRYMDAHFRESGRYGKYMMRASASTQVSVDYRSESDLIRKVRILLKISPILMIMMESKSYENSTLPEHPDKPHLLRTQEWDDLDPARTGFCPDPLAPDFGYRAIAEAVFHTPLILLTDGGVTTEVGNKTAADLEAEGIVPDSNEDRARTKRLVEHFLSMGFFHFRIKRYIEIRIADSVPIQKAMGYAALLKGIVYSDRNLEILEEELAEVNATKTVQETVLKIEKEGREAVIYKNLTAEQWIFRLIELAGRVLPESERKYLQYV